MAAFVILSCIRRWRMTRKDSEKETDRPHYYSQFWLDVAAGRTVIGGPKVEDEEELFYDEEDEDEDEDGWSAHGRKKPKPGRQVKPLKPTKKPKREPRRGF